MCSNKESIMNISPLSVKITPTMKANTNKTEQTPSTNVEKENTSIEPNELMQKYPPALIGLMNGVCWASVGYAFDKGVSKIFKMGTKSKTSLAINTIIGVGTGIYSYIQAKKVQNSNIKK